MCDPQTTPVVILAGTDYTGIPTDAVFEHVRACIAEEYSSKEADA